MNLIKYLMILAALISFSNSNAQGVYDYYLAISSPPFYVLIKNTLGKVWDKQHEILRKNKVRKVEVFGNNRELWFMFLISKQGLIEYRYWYNTNDTVREHISYDKYGNFYFSAPFSTIENPWQKIKYEKNKIVNIWSETYHYVDPEKYNPPVMYNYKYEGDLVKKIEVLNADNDSLFAESIFKYDKDNRVIEMKSKFDQNIEIYYSGDTIKRVDTEFFDNIIIKNNVIISENSGLRDSIKYKKEWKNPNYDYLFFENYLYLDNGLLDKIVHKNLPSGEELITYFRYKFYSDE